MFIGRNFELRELENAYRKKTFEFPVLYGRRRVGKSKLIQHFIENKPTIFFTAIESNSQKNLELLSVSIWKLLVPDQDCLPPFRSYEEAFVQILKLAKMQKIIFVIDEFPYLAAAEKSISSLLQSYIDNHFSNTDMMLILCGSSMSFMENQVLGYQSPLYGRRTSQFKIMPFDYWESAQFVRRYTNYEKAIIYGITSGIPKYLELVDDQLTLKENITNLFLKPNGYLYEEPMNLLKQELREPANYNAIIEAIARGASKLNEISTAVGMDTSATSIYLKTLISLGIVSKESAVTEENNRKKTLYSLADTMFCFWYRYVINNSFLISSGDYEALYDSYIKPTLNDFMGRIFEDMCKQYMKYLNNADNLPIKLQSIGRWWGSDPQSRKEVEIDILGIDKIQLSAIFGECKFRKELTGLTVLNSLIDKSQLLTKYRDKYYCIFSLSGFKEEIVEKASDPKCFLFSLEDMYNM